MNTTTRRYARSLSEAFPDERAHCIEGPERGVNDVVPFIVGFLGALFAGVLLFHAAVEVFK